MITRDCIACGICLGSCPDDAIIEGEIFRIDSQKCIGCGICIDSCPLGVIVGEKS